MCAPLSIPVVASCGGWRRTVFEAPANSTSRNPRQDLLPQPAAQRPPLKCPIPVPRVSQLRAIPQPSNNVLDMPPSSAGPANALPRVIQEGRTTPGKKQTQSNTWTLPAWVPVAMSTTPRSHLWVNLPLPYTHLHIQPFLRWIIYTARGLGVGPRALLPSLEQPNPLPLDLGAPSAPGIFTLHSPPHTLSI